MSDTVAFVLATLVLIFFALVPANNLRWARKMKAQLDRKQKPVPVLVPEKEE